MCCEITDTLELPAEVIEALAAYRRMLDERSWDWGDERFDVFRIGRFMQFQKNDGTALRQMNSWTEIVRALIGSDPPVGTALVHVAADGSLSADVGPPRTAIDGQEVAIDLVIHSEADEEVFLAIGDRELTILPSGTAVETVRVKGSDPVVTVALDGQVLGLENIMSIAPAATLHLTSKRCARWSVIDDSGGGWFPDDSLAKWDFHNRPFFHGHDVTLRVPAVGLEVVCARGLEFERKQASVTPREGEVVAVDLEPERIYDPAATSWFGGDLHVHMNYSGDLICTPSEAAKMQIGEGLHLVNLVAANCLTSLVYDRDMLERFPGVELAWSGPDAVAQMGIEYRNDLLGHVHALGPSRPPSRYYTGHLRSDHPEDWPPNTVACEEIRSLGATIGYCHPVFSEFPEGSTRRFFRVPRSVEARELVADAALGLVDSIDLISPANSEGATFLYHRLLSCGIRLAATAGTDTFLSFSHSGTFSNPPGWGRVYAHLDGRPLSVEAFKDAIRSGRTIVTNGPWVSLEVNGHGPGAVIDAGTGDTLRVTARVAGPGVQRLSLEGPDGEFAGTERAELELDLTLNAGPLWIAAIARGPEHSNTLAPSVFAHTSPVYVDVDGQSVARAADARWCLDFLDSLETLVTEHGHFAPETRNAHLGDVIAVLDKAREFYRAIVPSGRA